MCCFSVIIGLLFPRVVLLLLFLLTNYLQRAYHSLIVLLVGFIFLPLTTLAYAWMVNNRMPLEGANLIVLLITVLLDLGSLGGGEWHRRRRW